LIVGLKPGVLLSISFTKEWKRDTVIPALPVRQTGMKFNFSQKEDLPPAEMHRNL
jgi:hypothetical protein